MHGIHVNLMPGRCYSIPWGETSYKYAVVSSFFFGGDLLFHDFDSFLHKQFGGVGLHPPPSAESLDRSRALLALPAGGPPLAPVVAALLRPVFHPATIPVWEKFGRRPGGGRQGCFFVKA